MKVEEQVGRVVLRQAPFAALFSVVAMHRFPVRAVGCALVALLPTAPAQAVTFSDQNFLPQDWTPLIHVRDDEAVAGPPPLTSGGSMTRAAAGGNPGAYLRSFVGIDLGDIVHTSGIYIAESYDPREQAISSLDYSYDVNHFDATPGTGTDVLPALLQDGRLFVGSTQLVTGNSWQARSQSNLEEDDFIASDFWFTGATIRPDFSAFGSPIQFGYSLSNRVAFGVGVQQVRGVDDWSVTIDLAAMSDIAGDGVDGADLDFWREGFGIDEDALLVDGDFDRDGDVDGEDFLKWQRQLGLLTAAGPTAGAIPEPSAWTFIGAAVIGCLWKHRPSRRVASAALQHSARGAVSPRSSTARPAIEQEFALL